MAPLLLLLLLSRLCSKARRGLGAAVIKGSIAIKGKEREGLEHRVGRLGACRMSLRRLSIAKSDDR